MKIIIAGGRDITDYSIVLAAILKSKYWNLYHREIEVVCGMAHGVDALGKEFAERNGLILHEFPADWKTHGRKAGPIRNAEMGNFTKLHGGRLLAIWDGTSIGTKNMITWAEKNDLGHYVYRVNKP